MDVQSVLSDEDDTLQDIGHEPSVNERAPEGGVLILDKHVVFASLRSRRHKWGRLDLLPLTILAVILFFLAFPALSYEAQRWWLYEPTPEELMKASTVQEGKNDTVSALSKIKQEQSLDLLEMEAVAEVPKEEEPRVLTENEKLLASIPVPPNMHFYFMYFMPLFAILVALLQLFTFWNVKLQLLFQYKAHSLESLNAATHIHVKPVPHGGAEEICPLIKEKENLSFFFQKTKYTYHTPKPGSSCTVPGWFSPLDFPVNNDVLHYLQSQGIPTLDEVGKLTRKYGPNNFDIPLPTFGELFQEHALAPFFVFQIFCVLLWCLDEYWYYSLMTLFMLIMFEATVVKRRLKHLEFLREMRIPPYKIYTYREKKWQQVMTDELVPGDIVSVVRPTSVDQVLPCDLLLLSGGCVVNESMLTGESIPQQKEAVDTLTDDEFKEALNINKQHKRHVLFGGTKVVLHHPSKGGEVFNLKHAPDNGCVCYVLRTGFNSSQGKLVRTILFSTERVSVDNKEALFFIGFLLIFAIAASAYVLMKGLEDVNRSRYKLMLNCIMIVTSVVPPELPMELSLAVNTSLMHLAKNNIFCTEPFRIPLAGAVDVCCFDKTGTLTADEFVVRGIAGVKAAANESDAIQVNDKRDLVEPTNVPNDVKYIIAGCHSLTYIADTGIIGDPLEQSAFAAIGWSCSANSADVAISKNGKERVKILQRYAFSSALKRMSCIVALDHDAKASLRVVTKGAAEALKPFFSTLPDNYEEVHTHYERMGCRVLALGYKQLNLLDNNDSRKAIKHIHRDEVESGLTFAGFLVLQCPLKKGTKESIVHLLASSHHCVMITGDHLLTALNVATELTMISASKPTLILTAEENDPSNRLHWKVVDNKVTLPFNVSEIEEAKILALCDTYDLAITGDVLECLMHRLNVPTATLALLCSYISVFARTSPEQKELILHWFKSRGFVTLMAGDGSNDTGALKQSHIGVALIGHDQTKKQEEKKEKKTESTEERLREMARRQNIPQPRTPQEARAQLSELMKQLEKEMAEENATPRLGDASIASPFTSKVPFITSTVHILRQGRCTLVTTLQMFNILGINCLITAYSMSVLYLDGVKMGDTQMTISGLAIAMFFLFISRSEPLDRLSAERPHSKLFTPFMFLSIMGQFAVHMYVLLRAVASAQPHTPTDEATRNPEGEFSPNVLNTVVYLVSTAQMVATFAANYRGRPFMQGLSENNALLKSLGGLFTLMLVLAAEIFPDLNEALQLHPLPSAAFQMELIGLLCFDLGFTYVYMQILRNIFTVEPKHALAKKRMKQLKPAEQSNSSSSSSSSSSQVEMTPAVDKKNQ